MMTLGFALPTIRKMKPNKTTQHARSQKIDFLSYAFRSSATTYQHLTPATPNPNTPYPTYFRFANFCARDASDFFPSFPAPPPPPPFFVSPFSRPTADDAAAASAGAT